MKTYIVVALVCQGLGNNIFRAGDECQEDQFPAGHAEKLVEQGFLAEKQVIAEEAPKAKKSKDSE